jgi:repressor LexA
VDTRRRDLTPRQAAILRFIETHHHAQGAPPTVREIGAEFGIGPAGAFGHLKALEHKGRIRRADRGSRKVETIQAASRSRSGRRDVPRGVPVPIVGRIAAGPLSLAEQHIDDYLLVEEGLMPGAQLFALRVKGQSMIGAGILDGDYVIARQQPMADDRDVVVARIGDEATVKRLRRDRGGWRLHPENPDYEIIPLTKGDAEIQGKVVAVYRRLT